MIERGIPLTAAGFIWHQLRAQPVSFALFVTMVAGAATSAVAVQYGMKLLVDAMAGSYRGLDAVYWSLFLFLSLIAAESALWRTSGVIGSRSIIAAGVNIRLGLFRHMTGHAMRYFGDHLAGALGQRVTATAGHFGSLIGTIGWKIVPPCVDFLGALVIFASIRPPMAVALVAGVALIALSVLLLGRRGRSHHLSYAAAANLAAGELIDVVANIWSVKAFNAQLLEYRRLRSIFSSEAVEQRSSWFFLEKMRILHDVVLWAVAGAMLLWAVVLWHQDRISPGDVVVISALTFRVLHGSRDLALATTGAANDLAFIGETLATIGAAHEIRDAPDAKPLTVARGAIRFEGVKFSHRTGSPLFEQFSLSIAPGRTLGILGRSGSGKSTLIGLLQRLYDPQQGRILIDEQPIHLVTQESLHGSMTVVPQDCSLFHRTIMENIRYGCPDATDAEVREAAEMAQCTSFIETLPRGYDTVVGERGALLSGGQRQRVAIARAILSRARIVLFDEATSALDTLLERDLYAALQGPLRSKTVIVVAHRLTTLAGCDEVLVLDNGRIVEIGPPARLLNGDGAYARFMRSDVAA
jgi:ATP-binding cassette subfamily B protein